MLREEKTLCHPEPFDKLKACPEPVEGINCVKDLKILRRVPLLGMTYSQSF